MKKICLITLLFIISTFHYQNFCMKTRMNSGKTDFHKVVPYCSLCKNQIDNEETKFSHQCSSEEKETPPTGATTPLYFGQRRTEIKKEPVIPHDNDNIQQQEYVSTPVKTEPTAPRQPDYRIGCYTCRVFFLSKEDYANHTCN